MSRMRSNLAVQNRAQFLDILTYVWLKLLEPTGWTMTFDLPFEPSLDEVSILSPIEMLLWNAEPCPGPPTRDYPGAIENAAYRLVASASWMRAAR